MKYLFPSMFLAAAIGVIAPVSQAEAATFVFAADLNGPNEAPPNTSPGTGTALVTLDDMAHTMRVQATFSGLTGITTAAHIHSATAVPGQGTVGVATTTPTFPDFPLGVTNGTYDRLFDMTLATSYSTNFINNNGGTPASAEIALFDGIKSGKAYLNIHTNQYPGGEIRGFLVSVPESSSTLGFLALGTLGAGTALKRQLKLSQSPEKEK